MNSCNDPAVGKYVLAPDAVISREQKDALAKHVQECRYCQLLMQRYDTFVELARREADNHLSFEEIVSSIDRPSALTADEQTRIETHLFVCERCQNLMSQLPSLDDLVKTFNAADQLPSAAGLDNSREQLLLRRIKEAANRPKDATDTGNDGEIPHGVWGFERIRQIVANYRANLTAPRFRLRPKLFPTFLYATLLIFLSAVLLYFFLHKGSNVSDQISKDRRPNQQSSPSSSASPTSELRTTTAHAPAASPMPTGSPWQKTPILDSQDVAVVIDPSRAVEPRQRILLKHSYLRFSVHLKSSSGSSSYQVELIDEDKGTAVSDSKVISARHIRLQHKLVLVVEARHLVNGFYTLRVTGMDASSNPNEVYTSYFEIVR